MENSINKDQPQDDPEVRISKDLKTTILTVIIDERKNMLMNESTQNFSKAKL